jgi:hypothetical protein
MHKNEAFLKNISDEELLLLMFEAQEKGPQYVDALKEQIQRLDEE